jgi:3-phosphoshikimate 1-carboxyvinyltransferase
MNTREIIPFPQSLKLTLTLPGSKSITNRALLCAALARGTSRIRGALFSDDTLVMLKALRRLGITIKTHKNNAIAVTGNGGQFHSRKLKFALGNAGTATRFLTAIMSVRKGQTIITGNERMQQRPIGDLVDGLRQMGAQIDYCKKDGFPPLTIKACVSPTQQPTYVVKIKGDKSSQYFSALLILGSLLDRPLQLHVIGDLVSKPYINTTIAVMKAFGVRVKNNNYRSFVVKPQTYKVCDYEVEGDASAGSYWSSINYLHSGHLIFSNLNKKSVQGDVNYPNALGQLGKGKVDMNAMPDSAMTLAITAPFVKGKTQITGLGNLRIKETDRLKALQTELHHHRRLLKKAKKCAHKNL